MFRFIRNWVLVPVAILSFLGAVFWIIGLIQYRLNVMDIEEYEPVSTLRVPHHNLTHARFPFIDVHNHQWIMPIQNLDKLVVDMDSLHMGVMVNLSGFRGKFLEWSLNNVKKHQANRFVIFMNLNF